jgi:hypothetical protein
MNEKRKRALDLIEKWMKEEEEREERIRRERNEDEPKPAADSGQERLGRSEKESD